jgi:hypothetical protein
MTQREEWRKRPAFDRVVKSLVRKHRVKHVDGWVWLPKEDWR